VAVLPEQRSQVFRQTLTVETFVQGAGRENYLALLTDVEGWPARMAK